jgi:hypothetical protein
MRFRWPLGTFTLVLLFASLGWNLWSHESGPVDAFYLPWARCWELLAGAWLAYALGQGQVQLSPQSQRFMAPVGLGLLVSAWWLIHQDAAFPGWWALMPVVGTALIIASGPLSWVNRKLLAHRWMVGIGLISYPLYLWHWPLISWLHITEGQTPPKAWLVAALGLSFVLAYATWRWVERPLRFGANAKRVALLLLSAVAAIGAIGWYVYMMDGVKERVAAKVTLVYSGDHGHHSFFDWMEKNTVSGRFSESNSSETRVDYEQVRIPVYDDKGRALDARQFARELVKYMKQPPFNIEAKMVTRGLGEAIIILGEK